MTLTAPLPTDVADAGDGRTARTGDAGVRRAAGSSASRSSSSWCSGWSRPPAC